MKKHSEVEGPQPEALATFAAAAKTGGKKPEERGLAAAPRTAPLRGDLAQEADAATKVLREGVTHQDQGAAPAVRALPDRAGKRR